MTPELTQRLKSICSQAVGRYGATSQMNMLQEECAEYIVALSHMRRGRVGINEVADEVADIVIMCEQARLIFGGNILESAIERKLARLEERLEKEKRNADRDNR
jgi:NTP pyrophosphatase (non-canonical NTP hydrolase)